MRRPDGSLDSSISLTIDDNGRERSGVITADYRDARHRTSALMGLVLYGPTGPSTYLGKVFEWRADAAAEVGAPGSEVLVETFVLIDETCVVREVFPSRMDVDSVIRVYGKTAYVMRLTEVGLVVAPLAGQLTEGSSEHWFATTVTPPGLPQLRRSAGLPQGECPGQRSESQHHPQSDQ